MARGKKRGLSKDDAEVWRQVVKHITPLSPHKRIPEPSFNIEPVQQKVPLAMPKAPALVKPFQIGEKATAARINGMPDFRAAPSAVSPNMDKRNFQRLLKGKMEIEGTLDLHGMTAEQARVHLTQYLKRSHAAGMRMILVITGKGRHQRLDEFNRPVSGVLRENLPDWLRGPALGHLVLQVTPAQQRHGGSGAWYVYLRRKR